MKREKKRKKKGSERTAAAMVWDASNATTSAGEKPASANLARMEVTLSIRSVCVSESKVIYNIQLDV